jgi:hypothetical protein
MMMLPVRRTSTHWTTGGVPITVQARRVVPVEPLSEYAVLEFSDRILTAPDLRSLLASACTVATHDGLALQPLNFASMPFTSPFACAWMSARSSSRSTFSVDRNLASTPLIARNSRTPVTISATRFRTADSLQLVLAGADPQPEAWNLQGIRRIVWGTHRSLCRLVWLGSLPWCWQQDARIPRLGARPAIVCSVQPSKQSQLGLSPRPLIL